MVDIYTNAEKLACIDREIGLRKRVYRNRVETGRMKATEAAYQIAVMIAIREDYLALVQKERLL